MLNRKKIKQSDYNKNLNQLVPNVKEGNLDIYVYNKDNPSENSKQNFSVIFWFKSKATPIECSLETKMLDICKSFSDKIGKEFETLNFKYGNENLNFTKTFKEIMDQNKVEIKEIDIIVEEKKKSNNKMNKALIIVFSIIILILVIVIIILSILILKKKEK